MFHGDAFIHENCDEALFRPVVAVFGSTGQIGASADERETALRQQLPADIGQSLVLPVTELKQPVPKVDHQKNAPKQQPDVKERKKSDITKPAVVEQVVIDLPVKPKDVESPAPMNKMSKKALKKAAAAAAAKLVETTTEAEAPVVKAKKDKSRRNSTVKIDEIQREQTPDEPPIPSAHVTQTPPEDEITTISLATILKNLDIDQPTHTIDLPAPVWVEPPVPAVRPSKKSKSKNKPIEELTVIECFEQEFSSIQDSIFVDPVVTSTVVVKKSGRKSKPAAIIETSPIVDQEYTPEVSGSTKDSDSVELEFVDAFAPLEPFELNFELVPVKHESFDDVEAAASDDFVSLINFASPLQEEPSKSLADEMPASIRPNRNMVDYSPFQSCVEFVEQDDIDDDDDEDEFNSEEPPVLLYECQDSDYKSLEQEVDESTYLSLDQQPPVLLDDDPVIVTSMPNSNSNSSSAVSDEESSSQLTTTTTSINVPAAAISPDSTNPVVATYKLTDDEELQPLITRSILNHLLTASLDESLQFNNRSSDVELGQPLDDTIDPTEEDQDQQLQLDANAKARLPAGAAVGRSSKKSRRKRR